MKFVARLSRPEAPVVHLAPGQLQIVTEGASAGSQRLDCANGGDHEWAGAITRLGQWARDRQAAPGRSAQPIIVLSNHWVRYAVLSPERGRLRHGEAIEFARAIITERFGSPWQSAVIQCCPGVADEGLLAAAVPDGLLQDLTKTLAASGMRCSAIRPLFAHLLDRAHLSGGPADALIACVEPGRIVLARTTPDGWSWVHSPLTGEAPRATLEREIAREQTLQASAAVLPLYLFEHDRVLEGEIDPTLGVVVRRQH